MKLDYDPDFARVNAFFDIKHISLQELRESLMDFADEDIVVIVDGVAFFNINKYYQATEEFLDDLKAEAIDAPCCCKPIEYLESASDCLKLLPFYLKYLALQPHMVDAPFDRKIARERVERTRATCQLVFNHLLNAGDLVFSFRGTNDGDSGHAEHKDNAKTAQPEDKGAGNSSGTF